MKLLGLLSIALALAFRADLASAETVVGVWQWQAPFVGQTSCIGQTIFMQNGSYSEQANCGGYMATQTGSYNISGGRLGRTVQDYEPKTHWVIDLCPGDSSRPGCGHYEQYAAPPGGVFSYAFVGNGSLQLTDIRTGGVLVLTRQR